MWRRVVWYICTHVLHEPPALIIMDIYPDAAGSKDVMPCVYN